MSLDVLRAYIAGYSDKLLDNQIMAVQIGYWASYYTNSKHPKPVQKVSEEMVRSHQKKEQDAKKVSRPRPDIDVEAFQEREAQFKARMKSGGEPVNGR